MKLSEAIRLGSTLRPQGFGKFRNIRTTACALDAAALAIGMPVKEHGYDSGDLLPEWEKLLSTGVVGGTIGGTEFHTELVNAIQYWNDLYTLSREEIARRVEEVEQRIDRAREEDQQVQEAIDGRAVEAVR